MDFFVWKLGGMRDKVTEGISDRTEACQQSQLCNAEILFFFKVLYLKLYIHPCLVEPSTGVCGRIEAVVRPIKDFRFRREGHNMVHVNVL